MTRISGGAVFGIVHHFDAVSEYDSFDDFWQPVSAFEPQPFFRGRLNEGNHGAKLWLVQRLA